MDEAGVGRRTGVAVEDEAVQAQLGVEYLMAAAGGGRRRRAPPRLGDGREPGTGEPGSGVAAAGCVRRACVAVCLSVPGPRMGWRGGS